MAYPVPLTLFGWAWSISTHIATTEIAKVPASQLAILRYERVLADPRAELSRLAGFVGASADERWLGRAEEFTDPGRAGSAAAQLGPADLAELRDACAAGRRAFDLLESAHPECAFPPAAPAASSAAGTTPRSA
jgi:hypothetical protein